MDEPEPPPPDQPGGYDFALPTDEELETEAGDILGEMACQVLSERGFCVLETYLDEAEKASAVQEAAKLTHFEQVLAEVEAGYMGINNSSKFSPLELGSLAERPSGALETLDRKLTNLGMAIMPATEPYLNFTCWGRGNALVRLPRLSGDPTAQKMPEKPSTEDTNKISNFLQWSTVRRVSMLYVIECTGGTFRLMERDENDTVVATLPLRAGMLLLFRHDLLSYSFQPEGASLALQAWLLGEGQPLEPGGLQALPESYGQALAEEMPITGPPMMEGECANIMSVCTRFPTADYEEEWWTMSCAGTDLMLFTPFTRWDMQEYFNPDSDIAMVTGKTYSPHSSFISDDQIQQFDHTYFGMSYEEGVMLSVHQKIVLEEGVRAVHRMGFDPQNVKGRRMAVALGETANEWGWVVQHQHPDFPAMCNQAVTCSRLSYELGLKGPTSTHDTACSSSIVALSTVHHFMRTRAVINGRVVQLQSDADTIREALVGSASIYLTPWGWIGECSAGMLSAISRTQFTEARADGFVRGEGAGMLSIRWTGRSDDLAAERLAILCASSLNQDGRSATLTAPNGPAQQANARNGLKEAGTQAIEVQAHECHGTGTALGDPIEVGALRAVYSTGRRMPMVHQGIKSSAGHLEACAGLAGLAKVVMMVNHVSTTPNVHLCALNPHINDAGYCAHFPHEMGDCGYNSVHSGLSSFGFGGTNSRADVWGIATRGPRAVVQTVLMDDQYYVTEMVKKIGRGGEVEELVKIKNQEAKEEEG